VAIVEACSTARERTLTLTLGELAAGRAQDWLDATQPSLLMIGEAFAARAGQERTTESGSDDEQATGRRAAA
jgi:uroporphyrin-III C-methyltransferase